MKKQGFTLIELLAVIVILAIIALIATPMILGVIEKSRKGAFQDSVYGILDGVDYYLLENGLSEIPTEGIDIGVLKLKNNHMKYGKITGDIKSPTISGVSDGTYCAYGTKQNLTIHKGECDTTAPQAPEFTGTTNNGNIVETFEEAKDQESGIAEYKCYYGTSEADLSKIGTIKGKTCEIPIGEEWYGKICGTNYAGMTSCSNPKQIVKYLVKDGNYISEFTEIGFSNKQTQNGYSEYQFLHDTTGRLGLYTTNGFSTVGKPNVYVDLELNYFELKVLDHTADMALVVGKENGISSSNINIRTDITLVNADKPIDSIPRKIYELKGKYPDYNTGVLTIVRYAHPASGTFRLYNIWLQY